MKVPYLHITRKDDAAGEIACGNCFSILDDEDEFCWNCGAEISEEGVSFAEDLPTSKKEKK